MQMWPCVAVRGGAQAVFGCVAAHRESALAMLTALPTADAPSQIEWAPCSTPSKMPPTSCFAPTLFCPRTFCVWRT